MTVRFLLDEHLSPAIAAQLAARSIDAVAVAATPQLRTLPDDQILEAAAAAGRVLVTRNIGDFVALDAAWHGQGRRHGGILLIAARRFAEDSSLIGALVRALSEWATAGREPQGSCEFL